MSESRRRRVLLLVLVAAAAMGVAGLFRATGWLHRTELASIDARFALRSAPPAPRDVVIVGIDRKTLGAGPNTLLPLDRHRDARVIKRLKAAGAKVIAYDVEFINPTTTGADNAAILAVRGAAPRVVLGTADVGRHGRTEIFGGSDGLAYSRGTPAATEFGNDSDGRIRHMPFAYSGLRSFALAALAKLRGHPVATPPGNSAWIDFPRRARELSFADVERGAFDPAAVRAKIVVVGVTDERAGGLLPTSTSAAGLSGPQVEAAAIDTAQRGFPLKPAAGWVDTLLALLVAAAAPLAALALGPARGAIAGLVVLAGYLVAAQIAFGHDAILAVVPAVAGGIVGVVGTALVAQPHRSAVFNRFIDRVGGTRGNRRTRRLRAALLLGAAAAISAAGLAAQAGGVLHRADLSTVNMRFSVRGSQPAPRDIELVAIDANTYNTPPKLKFPFDRHLHAKVLRNLEKAGAKVIAYDVQFTDRSPSPSADRALIAAARAAGPDRVVMASTDVNEDGQTQIFGGPTQDLPYSRAIQAFSAYPFDADGRDRRMLLDNNGLQSFDLAAASLYRGHPIRTPPGHSAWIDYTGPPFHVHQLSFRDVLNGRFPASAVRGKIVVVGSTASVDQDLHPTSTSGSSLMPGPEIHVNGIQTALDGFPLRSTPWWVDSLLIVLFACLTPLLALRVRRLVWLVGLAALVALLVGVQVAFAHGAIVSFVYALVAGVLAILATASINGLTVAFEREQARDAFARFVPETVVDQVLADADGVRLGGVRRAATVLFSDLRGFTSFSETLEPEQVIEALNRYLTAMSEAILDHGGTLVAYMGDGIMAVFGAPMQQDDHADRALEASREMLERLQGFNGWLREQGLHDGFKMGIGLNSGPVMSGNVGSERRLEYTALGDTTNTAARLEGMTKGTPHQLYVSDTTHQALTRPAEDLVPVGEAEVRGRKAKVQLWSLADADVAPTPAPAEEPVETQ